MKTELKKFLEAKDFDSFIRCLEDLQVSELVPCLAELDDETLAMVCNGISSEILADAILLADSKLQEKILMYLHDEELKDVMDEVSVDDTVDIIEEMPQKIVRRIAEEEEIIKLTEEKNFVVLKPLLSEKNATDLAKLFEAFPENDIAIIFRILPKELAAETFVEMDSDLQEHLINSLNDIELKTILDELFLDDTVDIIEEMPANVVKRILAQSDAESRNYINELLKYPEDSAGSIMTIEFIWLKSHMTVKESFQKIRKIGIDKETVYTCYVVDDKNKLIGIVTVKDMLLSDMNATIGSIMEENVIYTHTLTDKEDVARTISKYGFLSLPVVDTEKRLVGIVTVDDAMDVMQDEVTEDIAKMSAVTPSDKPYLKTGVFKLWLNRVPWLLILMVSATFTGLIISANEETLNMATYGIILTACIPMLMDTGGNAGSQASVTIIRGIALGEVNFKDIFKVIWKEVRVSLLLGLTLAIACFAKLMAVDRLWAVENGFVISFVICITMFLTIVIAKLIGCTLPILAKKCKLDPAVVASPFITTIVDAISLTVYCGIAVSLLSAL